MAKKQIDLGLTGLDELFMDDRERAESKLPKIHEIPLSEIDEFPNHPFHVRLDEDMDQLVESIKERGIITPVTLRQKPDGRYEIVSGHRRAKACELAGLTTVKAEIKELSRDEAIILIRFITPNYKEKFRIADGDSIRMTFPSGETQDKPCRFVDETHLEVGNSLYHICEFAERIQRECIQIIPLRQSLPEKCFSALEATGEIITVTKGEKGYTPTGQYPQNGVSPKEAAAALNDAAGVTKAQEAAMVAGSMFGWDTPAADPKNYDAKGVPIKNHRERDAR